jgi:triacylglycerol lipase
VLARVQKIFAFALLAASLAWAACFVNAGHPVWGGAAALLILLGYALFLGAEFLLRYFLEPANARDRPRFVDVIRAWWGEVVCVPKVFYWRQPFRSNAEPDNVLWDRRGQRGVILVHGFFCNRGLWNPWMRELRVRQVPFIAVNLEPLFGSIDHYPRVIEAAVARLEAATALPVVLVGHSMGGLAIRAWLAQYAGDARVRRVITIGSPHHGTWLARCSHTPNSRQMRLHSPWLQALAATETAERRARFTCFFGHCDNIVFPAASATLPGAVNLHVPATAHVRMVYRDAVFDEVWRWLKPSADQAASPPRV